MGTITNIQLECIPTSKHHGRSVLHYDSIEPNGSIIHYKRLVVPKFDSSKHANIHKFVQIQSDQYPQWIARIGSLTLLSNEVTKAAPAQNPVVAATAALTNQVQTLVTTNSTLTQTIQTQNQRILQLESQARQLQQEINGLNENIASLRSQLTVLPALIETITRLETQVENLTTVLRGILITMRQGQ